MSLKTMCVTPTLPLSVALTFAWCSFSASVALAQTKFFQVDPEIEQAASLDARLGPDFTELDLGLPPRSTPLDWVEHFTSVPLITWGVSLGRPVSYEQNPDLLLRPASNSKLFTTALALGELHADYRFQTQLVFETLPSRPGVAMRLRIIGSGDPTPMIAFETWETHLRQQGIHTIVGPILPFNPDPRWETITYPEGWDLTEDPYYCYGALPRALNYNYNCALYNLKSLTEGRFVDPDVRDVVTLSVTAGKVTQLALSFEASESRRPHFKLTGTVSSRFPQRFALPVLNPEKWVAAKLTSHLKAAGLTMVERELVTPTQPALPTEPAAAEEIAESHELTFFSPPLSELLVPFLKSSINLIGEALLLHVGSRAPLMEAEADLPSLLAAGQSAMTRFLRGEGLPHSTLRDGSGVSHQSGVTARELQRLLELLLESPDFDVVWNALPIAGVDGTLRSRMRGSPAENFLRAKTSTLTGVYNLAGYVPSSNGGAPFLPFVMLSETTSANRGTARRMQDQAGAELARIYGVSGTGPKSEGFGSRLK